MINIDYLHFQCHHHRISCKAIGEFSFQDKQKKIGLFEDLRFQRLLDFLLLLFKSI
jgi:hypothetical protein